MGLQKELEKTGLFIRGQRVPHQPEAPILRVQDLTLHYETGDAIHKISFELQKGERLAVVGPNGAGKSTLFKIIAGVLSPTSGAVWVYGNEPVGHICIAYVPQRTQVDWNFPVTVKEVIMMGRIGQMGILRWPRKKDWQIVQEAIELVNLADLADRQISELSGGQQQRMFIGRALAQEAELMLMDEPLSGLDVTSQEEIFQIMDKLHEKNVTVMVALHDLKLAAERFNKVMLLNHRMLGFGNPEDIFDTPALLEAYGGQLRLLHTQDGFLALEDSCCDDEPHFHEGPSYD